MSDEISTTQLLRDLSAKVDNIPTRNEYDRLANQFERLVTQLEKYVTRVEHDAVVTRLELQDKANEKAIAELEITSEQYKASRLPTWASWVGPLIISVVITIAGGFANYEASAHLHSVPPTIQIVAPSATTYPVATSHH